VSLFRTVVGIDPSGKRLALSAVRYGVGRPFVAVPPAVFELRGDREQAWLADAERILLDFVTHNGLAGSEARLVIPADKVFIARIAFPPLREKDLRPALALELDRLFPFPAVKLKFNWRRSREASDGKNVRQVVVAALSDYLGRWEELVARTGLTLSGAVPSGWALSAACRGTGEVMEKEGGLRAILRQLDGAVECTVMEGAEPFFSAVRACPHDAGPTEALALVEEALMDVSSSLADTGVTVIAPSGWYREETFRRKGRDSLRLVEGFEARAADAMAGPGGTAESSPVWGALGAYGAAIAEKELDLLSPEKEGAGFRAVSLAVTGALAAATLLLALSWPTAVTLRTRQEVRRIDAEIASLRPAVSRVEDTLAVLGDMEGRIHVLREAGAGREEPLLILRQLTERLPQGTWLTGLRIEDRKVEMDGLSPSANEIFPMLSRDGLFRRVEFASPITRQADNLERFQIRAEFSHAHKGKEGEGNP
jgi:general secretion pathway protein L